ncbi:hypothetical protein MTX20_37190 [Bradyrhizobium sp. ISRA435]|nr:hypothetical protein MTX20_37190 [Bradyrhizobium sp. ISRA435]
MADRGILLAGFATAWSGERGTKEEEEEEAEDVSFCNKSIRKAKAAI